MPKVKTITLDGEETAVKFSDGYPYYIITNLGDGELYASGNPDIKAYADGVYTILPGMETRISPEKSADTVYLLGNGKVQVRAEEIAVPTSFRAVPKGGGGESGDSKNIIQFLNGGVISPSGVNEVNLDNFTQNAVYVLNSNVAGSFINSPLGYGELWGTLIVINIDGIPLQIYFPNSSTNSCYRSKWWLKAWSSWKQI